MVFEETSGLLPLRGERPDLYALDCDAEIHLLGGPLSTPIVRLLLHLLRSARGRRRDYPCCRKFTVTSGR